MKQLLLASHNRDKAREFQDLLAPLSISLVTLDDLPQAGNIVEDADTLEGNALKKARESHLRTGMPAVGDDTGLEVFYLRGEPGVYSSRYAGPGASYADNVNKLLRNLRGVPPRRRGAQFRCVLAFVLSPTAYHLVEGRIQGVILEEPRGQHGFGYDPVFLPDGQLQTLAEMELAQKNAISHRGQAIRKFVTLLHDLHW
jgi:XTP/dITP diphosphohydrolase